MLVAATAALFVCAQAGAIQITSISPSGSYENPSEVLQHMNNMVDIRTDVDFKRVEWTFNGKTSIDNGTEDGTDTYSAFIPSLDGLGRPWGVKYAITATAYDNDNVSVSATTWFRVWKASNAVSIREMSGSADVVVGESFEAQMRSWGYFHRVEWYLKEVRAVVDDEKNYGDLVDTDYRNYRASFDHTFEEGDGSNLENGKAYRITAKTYDFPNPSGTPVMTDIWQIIVNVHEGKGKRAISGHSHISYVHIDPNTRVCKVDWAHGIKYYNDADNSKAHLYAWVKLYEDFEDEGDVPVAQFRSGDKENGVDRAADLILNLDRTFEGYVYEVFLSKPMPGNFAFRPERRYRFAAFQSLEDNEADDDWEDRENGGDTFWSQNWRFDPDDKFEGTWSGLKGETTFGKTDVK